MKFDGVRITIKWLRVTREQPHLTTVNPDHNPI